MFCYGWWFNEDVIPEFAMFSKLLHFLLSFSLIFLFIFWVKFKLMIITISPPFAYCICYSDLESCNRMTLYCIHLWLWISMVRSHYCWLFVACSCNVSNYHQLGAYCAWLLNLYICISINLDILPHFFFEYIDVRTSGCEIAA